MPYFFEFEASLKRSKPSSSAVARLTLSVLTTKLKGPKRCTMPISSPLSA